ncbi:glyoxylate/hydroxypyruvate reductase A [Colwellia sp. PAMC 21821]|uniref:2-hydroxyacid dehydrogenase n=1 Tax=Colwellia sp. PAMC 21821 TaxID=1816219 RepID=UPI0009C07A7D|nr:glyoxylate/hydroxypyruvate reductase A [Colwellia sp. PAMC 21821]ARD45205.1 glyoxylate/hydroxypyruvate reductase A [Colwellia sp. PAMC 21821]
MIPFINQLPKHEEIIWLAALNQRLPDENIVSYSEVKLAEKKAVKLAIVANPDTDLLAEYENLIWIHSLWAGVEHLMIALADSPIEVVRLIDPTLSRAMSEAVLAWSLYLHRDMPRYAKQQQNKHWLQHQLVPASERRIGILGLGELGQVSAAQLQQNGFNVMGWSRTAKKIANISCFSGEHGLAEMLAQSDILVCLLPLTPATRGMVNKNLLTQLPQGSGIINFARGGITNTDDLLAALNSDHISHAVLDVFEHEPLTVNSELWQHPDITILPHISAPTNINSACDIVATNIHSFRATGQIPKAVSKINGY